MNKRHERLSLDEKKYPVVSLKLDISKINMNVIEKLLVEMEKGVRSTINRIVRDTRIFDYNLVITAEKTGKELLLDIELSLSGGYPGRISYDEIVERALDEAERKAVEVLRKYVRL